MLSAGGKGVVHPIGARSSGRIQIRTRSAAGELGTCRHVYPIDITVGLWGSILYLASLNGPWSSLKS